MASRKRGSRGRAQQPKESTPLQGEAGQVVAHHGVAVLVKLESGLEKQVWLTPEQRAVVGDRVTVAGARLEVLPARGVLRRRDPRGRERTIANNLDVLSIVVAIEPREPPGYIDRGFVIARAAEIEPCIIVNKVDLPGGRELADRLEEIYGDSAAVYRVSAETGEGLDSIREMLAGGGLGAMVGASGVGKSSLMNALVPDLDLRVSDLNRGSGKGRHTTTTATLHPLESGGFLVDTAGFKDFIAVDVTLAEAAEHFPGFEVALEAGCRFRDCAHKSEPGCGVLAALEAGEIEAGRHRAYLALLEELSGTSDRRGG
jgi:ribosome biogenesis GTPase / thiamine phosphate phosphatase